MHILSKKIIIISFLVIVGLAVAAGLFFSGKLETDKTQSPSSKVSRKALYEGIAQNLATLREDDQLKTSMLIPGNTVKENVWSFSGTFKGESTDRPFFGQIKLVCEVVETHACWKLQKLVIDGTPYTLANEEVNQPEGLLPEEVENQVVEAEPVVQEEDTSTRDEESSADETDKTVTTLALPPKAPAVEAPVVKEYQTVTDNVNARMGPGSDHEIAFKMPSSVTLKLVDKKEKWGLFEYNGSNGQIGQVWISLALVKEVK